MDEAIPIPVMYETCTGPCGGEYLYPHLCREHLLCGLCHPLID